jgi:hypothetical protein
LPPRRGWALITSLLVESLPVASDRRALAPYAAWCHCGASLAEGVHRVCVGAAAVLHSARVEVQSTLLLSRLRAIHLMGTLDGELRPLSAADRPR